MHRGYVNVSWIVWILAISCMTFNPLLVSSTTICTACEEKCPAAILNSGDCFCEHHKSIREFVDQQVLTYSFAKCFELKKFDENSFLNSSICSEEDSCESVKFSRSKISTVHTNFFKNLSHLLQLHLNNSAIQNLQVGAFNDLPYLRYLHLDNNELKEISNGTLNALGRLRTLYLNNNQISNIQDMAFVGLEYLWILDLSNNRLSAISYDLFEPLGSLTDLKLSYNFLSVVDFHTAKSNALYLNNNNIERIEGCFEGTESLFLQDNRLSNFNGSCVLDDLRFLNLANNNISFVDSHTMSHLINLEILNMSKNAMTDISVDMFKGTKWLLTLDLSHNKIRQLRTGVFRCVNKTGDLYSRDLNGSCVLDKLRILNFLFI